MKRSGIQRNARLQSSGPIKPQRRTAQEQREKFAREYGSSERCGFVGSLPCANCGRRWDFGENVEIENAHTENDGKSRKGHYTTIVPLCVGFNDGCHNLQHQHGWSRLPRLDTPEKREAAAARTEKLWLAHVASVAPSEGTANAE